MSLCKKKEEKKNRIQQQRDGTEAKKIHCINLKLYEGPRVVQFMVVILP